MVDRRPVIEQVNENALRVPRSWVMWVTIISTMSYGSGEGDWRVWGILPMRRLSLVLLLRQAVIMRAERFAPTKGVAQRSEWFACTSWVAKPETEDVGFFERPRPPAARDIVIMSVSVCVCVYIYYPPGN